MEGADGVAGEWARPESGPMHGTEGTSEAMGVLPKVSRLCRDNVSPSPRYLMALPNRIRRLGAAAAKRKAKKGKKVAKISWIYERPVEY